MRILVVLGMAAAFLLTGCNGFREAMCRSEEYPTKAVGNTTGGTCVPEGQDPPSGYVRYPKGKEPKYVDDKWDKYWSTKIVDESGNVTETSQ